MEIKLLNDIIIIFGLSVVVIFIFHKFKVPSIVGFLLTGILAGPHGFGLVKAVHEVEILAEIGVILLLFTIGIEFSLKSLMEIKKAVFLGGSVQVVLTIAAVFGIVMALGLPLNESIFIGFMVALSSTAIVMKLFQDRAEVNSQHGKNSLAILIFQDIIIVPMMLLVPLLAGSDNSSGRDYLIIAIKAILLIVTMLYLARKVIPKLLFQIASTRNRELFLLSVIGICFGVAWLTSSVGLSLALGAFLAGLVISESEYSHQAIGNILPFKDIFTSFFFVSIGMLLDLEFFISQPVKILAIVLGVIILKTIVLGFVSFLSGYPFRTTVLVGLSLSQIGEFSFILAKLGRDAELLSMPSYQVILSVAVISMGLTPFIIKAGPSIAAYLQKLPLPERMITGLNPVPKITIEGLKQHIIIVGFGVNGENVAHAARYAGIPYVIIEMNPETVRKERENGENIVYGDASQMAVLEKAEIHEAMVVVVGIPDPAASFRITDAVHRANPAAHIIVRTRNLESRDKLHQLGANEVVQAEFETSIEIFSRVLNKYLVPQDQIQNLIRTIKADEYEMLRTYSTEIINTSKEGLQCDTIDFEITALRVCKNSPLIGKTISEIGFQSNYQVDMLAFKRAQKVITHLKDENKIMAEDILIIIGEPQHISEVVKLLGND